MDELITVIQGWYKFKDEFRPAAKKIAYGIGQLSYDAGYALIEHRFSVPELQDAWHRGWEDQEIEDTKAHAE